MGNVVRCCFLLCLVVLWFAQGLAAQSLYPAALSSKGNTTQNQSLRRPAGPIYDVIALRVEFQPDSTRFTTGNGTFDSNLFESLEVNIDPFPHDAAYFDAHLGFLKHYVEQVSRGQTQVRTHLIPEIIQVSQPMGVYSPTGPNADGDEELRKLAALIDEAWNLADALSSFDATGLDPATTAFMIFHAGSGRDIELVGTTLDKTPEDLPSLYFDERALNRLSTPSAVSFKGLPVTNTAVLPETESRVGFDFISQQDFLIEISINGLIAASFFNYLGVPDLFDTESGTSAIGPYGLMDLGIFAYGGLFPPEPSAWTKYYLGWIDPVVVTGGHEQTVQLEAGVDAALVPISGAEFFLVENRNRDPEADGLVLQVWKDGGLTEQRISPDNDTFTDLDQSGFIGGVVVGVDNYDWALPGGLDADGVLRLGGVLIWHIDERRLQAGLPENRVNADPRRRAVDLEEADSGQDLGFPNNNPFAPQLDRGTPFDFYFEDNPVLAITETGEVQLYQNRFGPDTYPNSNTNEGGASFVVLEDFSPVGTEMSFTYRRVDTQGLSSQVEFLDTELNGTLREGASIMNTLFGIAVHNGQTTFDAVWWGIDDSTGVSSPPTPSLTRPVLDDHGSLLVWLTATLDGPTEYQIIGTENAVDPGPIQPLPEIVWNHIPASPLVVIEENGREQWVVAYNVNAEGLYVRYRQTDGGFDTIAFEGDEITSLAGAGPGQLAVIGRRRTEIRSGDIVGQTWNYDLPDGAEVGQAVFGKDAGGVFGVIPVLGTNTLLVLQADGTVDPIPVRGDRMTRFPVLVDLDDDGFLDLLTVVDEHLIAFSQEGAVVAGFPVEMGATSVAQPLVVRFSGQSGWTVIVAAIDGYVYAFDLERSGRQVPGFPLAVGQSVSATPLIDEQTLYAVSDQGSVRAWNLSEIDTVWWNTLFGTETNRSYIELDSRSGPGVGQVNSLLVVHETYNWPNPIRDGTTNLRFMTRADSRVTVMILDLAGHLVATETVENVRAFIPTEIVWQTDAASGLYVARVKAETPEGVSDSKLIKMAIIR